MGLPLETWLQAIADGIALGWLYILMALGLTLILSIMGILQLAHGEIYMIGAYVVYYVTTSWGVNVYVGILISMVLMAGVGILLQRVLFRPRPNADPVLPSIVISTGLTLILSSLAVIGFGLYEKALPPLATGSLSLLGGTIPTDRVVAVGFSIVALVALYVFLKRTRWGQAMVASAQDREAALLRGINPNHMARMAFAIACALAALAGALAGLDPPVEPLHGVAAAGEGPRHHRARRAGEHLRRGHRRDGPRAHRRDRAGGVRRRARRLHPADRRHPDHPDPAQGAVRS